MTTTTIIDEPLAPAGPDEAEIMRHLDDEAHARIAHETAMRLGLLDDMNLARTFEPLP